MMPNIFDYNPTNITPYPYWRWNKVLPAVYDDSLSQYELLSKLLFTVNEIISSQNDMGTQVEQLTQLVQQLIDGEFPSGIVQYVTDIVNAVIDDDIDAINDSIASLETRIAELETNSQRGDIVLIGDSYGEGYTPDGSVSGWTNRVTSAFSGTNINVYSSNLGGSGFGAGIKTFAQLLSDLASTMTAEQRNKVTTIIAAGGYNDRTASGASINTGMSNFHEAVKTYFKNAYRVTAAFIGSTVTGLTTGSHAGATSSSVRDAFTTWLYYGETQNYGISIYNGLGILGDNSSFASDYVHPSNRGQELIYQAIMSIIAGSPSSNFYQSPATITLSNGNGYTVSGAPIFTFNPVDGDSFGAPDKTSGTLTINYNSAISLTMNVAQVNYNLTPNAALAHRNFSLTRPVMILEGSTFHMIMGNIRFDTDGDGYHMRVQLTDTSDDGSNYRTASVKRITIYF